MYWQNATTAWAKPDTTTVYIITGNAMCSGNNEYYEKDTVTVTSVSVSASARALCGQDSVRLCATQGYASYLWNTGQTQRCITIADTGNYYVSIAANGCTAMSNPVYIKLDNDTPVVITQNKSAICPLDSAQLCGPAHYLYYYWNNGYRTPCFETGIPGTYYLTAIDSAGCTTYSNQLTVTQIPVTPADFTFSKSSLCKGDSTEIQLFGFAAVNVYPANILFWQNDTTAWAKPDSTTVFYITGNAICAANNSYNKSDTVTVTSVNVSASGNALCGNDSIRLCATPGYVSYLWNTGQFNPCIEIADTGYYYVSIADISGCSAVSSPVYIRLDSDTPVIITQNKSTICKLDSAELCGPANYLYYHWSNGYNTQCFETDTAGIYYLTVIDSAGCTVHSNQLTVTQYPEANIFISIAGDTLIAHNGISYQWLLNGSPITGATASTYIVKAGGTYTLQAADTNGCTGISKPQVISDIKQVLPENNLLVYPNPTNNSWQLVVSPEWINNTVEVFDAAGRLVLKTVIANLITTIDIFNAASGVYELHISSPQNNVVRKLIKL